MKNKFVIIMSTLMVLGAYCQVPQNFTYQAVIRGPDNKLVTNTSVGMQVSILQGSADGAPVYSESHTPETNTNGLISIEIGSGNSADDFSAIDWSKGPYFLKTETDISGGTNYTIAGISQLLSVPYALFAGQVANVDDADADPENELQVLSMTGDTLFLSKGGYAIIPSDYLTEEEDGSVTNEIQDLTSVLETGNDAGGQKISNLANPSEMKDAVNLDYLLEIAAYLIPEENLQFFTDTMGTFIDKRDGQEYKWVKIGKQIWMAENLNYYVKYDSTFLTKSWYYNNDSIKYAKTYGRLYSGPAAMNLKDIDGKGNGPFGYYLPKDRSGICPCGWEIPDASDIVELISYLGGSETAGGKLKEKGIEHWEIPNEGATNQSGFTAMPAGVAVSNEKFVTLGIMSSWYFSLTESFSVSYDNTKILTQDYSDARGTPWYDFVGRSVRCIFKNPGKNQ